MEPGPKRMLRRLAGIAIVLGLCAIPVLGILGCVQSLDGLGGLGDCGGGCQDRIEEANRRASACFLGVGGGALLVLVGVVVRRAVRVRPPQPVVPEARVVDTGRPQRLR
jgi:hypothetical protein